MWLASTEGGVCRRRAAVAQRRARVAPLDRTWSGPVETDAHPRPTTAVDVDVRLDIKGSGAGELTIVSPLV